MTKSKIPVAEPVMEFGEPPETRVKYPWNDIAARLQARPMEWALIYSQDRASLVSAIRQGAIHPVHPDKGFQTLTRNNTRGHPRLCDLWMRWNPSKGTGLADAIEAGRQERVEPDPHVRGE